MREILLGGQRAAGRVALVDDADYEMVAALTWHVLERRNGHGRRPHGPYAMHTAWEDGRSRQFGMHNLIMGQKLVDHVDHNGLNNQRDNMRVATDLQNQYNTRPYVGVTSPYKGVSWKTSSRRWIAQISINGRRTFLGSFADEIQAARAYDSAAREHFGEFAYLNFPDQALAA